MKTPITPLRMRLDLKERAKEQAEKDGYKNLSPWLFKLIEDYLEICK